MPNASFLLALSLCSVSPPDVNLLAKTLWGEARGCSKDEKVAVGWVVLNRVNDKKQRFGKGIEGVILKPWQFSCFNKNDLNRPKLENPEKHDEKSWKECLEVAKSLLSGELKDPTNGATHYIAKTMKNKPAWFSKLKKATNKKEWKHEYVKE